jgi:hypothetical protein
VVQKRSGGIGENKKYCLLRDSNFSILCKSGVLKTPDEHSRTSHLDYFS